jgi:osmotically-inducible protein OsmY
LKTLFFRGDTIMRRKNVMSDKSLLQKVNQRLARTGTSQSRVVATVRNGEVTLSGTIQYETQRRSIVRAIGAVAEVSRVVDQLKAQPKTNL